MSLRRAPPRVHAVGPVGLAAAAPAEASLFERTLNKQSIRAHLGSMTRRLKQEPISQVNPFLVGRQNMILDELKGGGGGGGGGEGGGGGGGGGTAPPPPPPLPDPRVAANDADIEQMQLEFAALQNDVEILQDSLGKRMAGMAKKRKEEGERANERLDKLEEESTVTKELQEKLKAKTEELEKLRNFNTQRKAVSIEELKVAMEQLRTRLSNSEKREGAEAEEAEQRLQKLQQRQDKLERERLKNYEQIKKELEFRKGIPPEDPDSEEETSEIAIGDDAKQRAAGARGKLQTETLSHAGPASLGLATDIAQLNPCLTDFRNKLLKAQQDQDDENLRKELEDYKLVIQDLREKLSNSREDEDAQRKATGALELQLEQEMKQVQALVKKLDDKTAEANKQLLEEMKSRRERLDKEVRALDALNQRPVVVAALI